MKAHAVVLVLMTAGAAQAEAPERSLHPEWRPEVVSFAEVARKAEEAEMAIPEVASAALRPSTIPPGVSGLAVAQSVRPPGRPKGFKALVQRISGSLRAPAAQSRQGQLCGIPGVQGAALSPIAGRVSGCGVAHPVKVTSVAGVKLSTGAVMDCGTARALSTWVTRSVVPAFAGTGGGVSSLHVAAGYACRPRNNAKGAKISEHGKGRAIDISAITLRDGRSVTVLKGWGDRRMGPILKALHKAACGPFGTVLGPGANRLHRDHFHLDTARYRAGSYCR